MDEYKNMKISVHCILACLYFLLLPTTIAVNSAGNSILKLATIPIAAYFVITIIFSKKELQFNIVHLMLCLYTLSTLVTLFVTSDPYFAIDTVVGYFLNTALYMCLTVIKYNKKELLLLENTQVLLLVILVMMTLVSNGISYDRTTLMIFGQTSDPNYFVGFFILPLSVTFKKIVHSKYRIVYILLVLLSGYCILMSGSRGGLLSVIVTVIAFALIYPPKTQHKLFVLLAGCCFMLFAWFVIVPILPENIVERLSIDSVVETGGSGRWYIWKSMLAEIKNSTEHLILGHGFYAKHKSFFGGKWGTSGSHNQIIQVLYEQGVTGLIVFLLLTAAIFLRCIKKRKTIAVAIIGMLALSMSLGFNQTDRTFWNLVAYAAFNFYENEYYITAKTLTSSEDKS